MYCPGKNFLPGRKAIFGYLKLFDDGTVNRDIRRKQGIPVKQKGLSLVPNIRENKPQGMIRGHSMEHGEIICVGI